MQKLSIVHATVSPSQTTRHANTVPPSRRQTAIAGFAGQLQSVLTELLAGEAYRHGIAPQLAADVGLQR